MISPIILYATPVFFLLIGLELVAERVRKTDYYRTNDAFGSLTLGITSRTSRFIKLSLEALVITHLLADWRLTEWSLENPWTWIATFILYDLAYYCLHRVSHTLNFFWAGHVVHHTSEEFNLTTALRQSSSTIFVWIFSLPILLLGAPVEAYVSSVALNLVYQFWVHTRHIDRLGFLEWFLVTPSHHRVHHAQNTIYIDKNHGGIFIIWDRLFGSFQEELAEHEPIYGARRALRSLNPISANIQVWWSLLRDAWYTHSLWDKLRIWFMPTGWRPADVEQRLPIKKTDLNNFRKYDPQCSQGVKWLSVFQIAAAIPANVYLLLQYPHLSFPVLMLSLLLLTAPLIITSMILEGKAFALTAELGRLLVTWSIFVFWGAGLVPIVWWSALVYLVISSVFCLANYSADIGRQRVDA